MKLLKKLGLAAFASSLALSGAQAQMQGVTDTEVLIGSNNDLSGIFAAFGGPATKAAQMVFDKANANGGVHGLSLIHI